MKKIIRWISAKFIKDHDKVDDIMVRSRYGSLEGWTSVVINTLLFVIKIFVGLSIRSVSLIADAVHTLSDCITSVVVIVAFRIARKPSDKEHPFGHGRIEFVATLIVSVLLFMAGAEIMDKSIHNIINPRFSEASVGIIWLIIATMVIKELLARFSFELGEIIDSKTLKADALHHWSDVLTTGLVVVALIASRFGYNRVDGMMGVLVSFVIFYSAYIIGKGAINPLLGEAPSKEVLKKVEKLAKLHEGVSGIHDIIFHKYGQTNVISLHIEVSDKEEITKLHAISEAVENEIAKEMKGVVVVHIDPVNKDHPEYDIVKETLKKIVSEDDRVGSFYGLRIGGGE